MTIRTLYCFIDFDKKTVLTQGFIDWKKYPSDEEVLRELKTSCPNFFTNYSHAFSTLEIP